MSFHELREALVCAFSDGVISEEEFLILYGEYESTNLNFPRWEYKPFSLDNFDSSEGRAELRVDKEDIPLLVNALQVPEYFRCPQGAGKAVRGGRGSDLLNLTISNKQTKKHSKISAYFVLKHRQRSTTKLYERSTTKQSVYLRTSTVDIHAFTPAPLRKP